VTRTETLISKLVTAASFGTAL